MLEDQAAADPSPEATPHITVVTNWDPNTAVPTYTAPRAAAGCGGVMVVILILLVLGVGGAVFAIGGFSDFVDEVSGTSPGLDGYTIRTATVLPGDEGSGGDVAAIVQGDDSWVLHYLDLDADDVTRWHDDLGVEAGAFDRYLHTPDTVYASVADKLLAWDRASGERRFAVPLSDVVEHTICVDCVQLIGQSLVALTGDGQLAGHDPTTGEPRWSVTLTEAPRQLLDVGGQAAVLDRGSQGETVVKLFEVAQGRQVGTIALGCGDGNGPGIYDYLLPLPDGGFFWEGTDIISTCAQRWAPGATSPTWSTPLPDGGSAVDNDDEIFAVVGDRVVAIHSGAISWYSLETGERTQTVRENENLTILGTGDGLLYVGAESTRGSSKWTILALDPASGTSAWSYEPGSDRLDGFTTINVSSTGWLVETISGGLVLISHDDDAEEVRLHVLSAADGTSSEPATIGRGDYGIVAWPSVIGTDDGHVVLGMGTTVLLVDPTSGEILEEAP